MFPKANTFTILQAHILFCGNAWIIVFTWVSSIYYLNVFSELLMFQNVLKTQMRVESLTK